MMNRCVRGSSVIKGILIMILTMTAKGLNETPRSLFLLFLGESTTDKTRSSGGNKTDFLSWWGESADGRWVTNVLLVTTTMWMLDWVHSNTSDIWPVASLDSEFVVFDTGLQDWLIGTATCSDDTDHGSAVSVDGLSGTGWKDDSATETIFGVTDDGGAGTRRTGELTLITSVLLNVHDDGTLWNLVDWEDVTDGNLGLSTAVDVLTRVQTFWGDVEFRFKSVFVWVSEDNAGNWGTSTWVVNYFFNETSDVSVTFSVI